MKSLLKSLDWCAAIVPISKRNRDKQEIMLTIMECISRQQKQGASKSDIGARCELNFYRMKQTLHMLYEQGFVTVISERYYLTALGIKTHQQLKASLAMVGFEPKINEPRVYGNHNNKVNGNREG